LNFQQGLGVNIIRNKSLNFGTSIGYYGSREEDDNEALMGLGDVDGGVDGACSFSFLLALYLLPACIGATFQETMTGQFLAWVLFISNPLVQNCE
jgi:hypothetical protein